MNNGVVSYGEESHTITSSRRGPSHKEVWVGGHSPGVYHSPRVDERPAIGGRSG